MNGSATNSSSLEYSSSECNDKSGRLSAGLLILFTTYFFEFFLGAPSNLWLLRHILRKMSKVSGVLPADFFPLHLTLIQLSFDLVLPLIYINHFIWQSNFVDLMMSIPTLLVLVMKPLLFCLICVEMYMAVVQPINYLWYKAPRYRWGSLGASWCIFILNALLTFIRHSYFAVCLVFLHVLAIDTFCCLSILKTLRKPPPGDNQMTEQDKKGEEKRKTEKNGSQVAHMVKEKQEQSGKKEEKGTQAERGKPGRKGEMNCMKRKAYNTIVLIQTILTLNYLPLIISLPLHGQVPTHDYKCQYMPIAVAAASSCSYLQPLLYLHKLGRLSFRG